MQNYNENISSESESKKYEREKTLLDLSVKREIRNPSIVKRLKVRNENRSSADSVTSCTFEKNSSYDKIFTMGLPNKEALFTAMEMFLVKLSEDELRQFIDNNMKIIIKPEGTQFLRLRVC